MEALQQRVSAVNVNGQLAPCVRAASSKPPASSHLPVRMRGTPLFGSNVGLRAKVLEQAGVVGDGKGASRACVVAMAKSAAHCYASALADVGQSDENLDSIFADLEKVGPFAKDEQFWRFFTSPVVKDDDKKAVIKTLSKEACLTASTTNLLYLLVTKKRTLILRDLLKEFEVIYNKLTDTEVALVTSAIEMDKSQLSLIGKKVQSMSGSKNVKLKNIIDPSIIAGFIVRFGEDGSRLIDMSVKGQLEKIASQIESADKVAAF
ncbi:hypothetical protein GOP47_0023077 [Adiantum capillus-veneris]|uniref:Uncharacterized protein n=1 Tax=Adiantum capillus-veneris TaxID=13818 RepID=A0A9D4U7P8_ADICA|nr:hypothetical protein GOP47_0023077 [Adiantum capillus-veneris]